MVNVLAMEIRAIDETARTLDGLCMPYDETSYLTPAPNGERVRRGAFTKSIEQRGPERILLFHNHDHKHAIGRAVAFADGNDGLYGQFRVASTRAADEALDEAKQGLLPSMSVGFRPINTKRLAGGEIEVLEAALLEVSLAAIGAYDSSQLLALRSASAFDYREVLEKVGPAPDIDFTPLPRLW